MKKQLSKFRGKYRVESARLKNYDYSTEGAYFITICTKNRNPVFGEIINGKLTETEQSNTCQRVWEDLPNHYPDCVLDAFVIMPDHVHAIIIIESCVNQMGNAKNAENGNTVIPATPVEAIHELPTIPVANAGNAKNAENGNTVIPVGAIHELPLRGWRNKHEYNKNHILCDNRNPRESRQKQRRRMLIPKIIGRFKIQVAKQINDLQKNPKKSLWQKNYHDRIIRNEDELNRIRKYIANNPLNWEKDRDNKNNIYM